MVDVAAHASLGSLSGFVGCTGLFTQDLVSVRLLARLLTWSKIANFDFVSAIDELSAQVQLEFDFTRFVTSVFA